MRRRLLRIHQLPLNRLPLNPLHLHRLPLNPLPLNRLLIHRCLIAAFTIGCVTSSQRCDAEEKKVDFQTQIRPILIASCTGCHGGVKQAGSLSFVYRDQVLPPGGWVIEPGDPEASLMIERIRSDDPDLQMPPPDEHGKPLTEREIQLLERWIAEGAQWTDHWSRAPLKQDPFDAANLPESSWARQTLDRFVEARLSREGLRPSDDAAPAEWLRRVSFDLTGLPPTPDELQSFVERASASKQPQDLENTYAAEVDRLLASQHFGERWASVWMDLARYADSKGFEKDPHRDMWPYRDWLVRAFNEDMPYDAFTIKQLAGDLIEDAEPEDLVATAFHRNTQTNTEGGTDDEEFRVAAVIDRVNTTWTVWQATTFGCVQCHAHPYDPITHEEYYAFMALLNDTADTDLDSDYPTVKIPANVEQRDDAIAKQRRFEEIRHRRNALGRDLGVSDEWSPMAPSDVSSTGGTLEVVGNRVKRQSGTFPTGVRYSLTASPSLTKDAGESETITALRLDLSPESDDPAQWPEQGSLVTHVKLAVFTEDAETEVELADVFVDAVTGDYDPRSVLDEKSNRGVGGYPKLHRPRWAVFVLQQPLKLAEGDRLKITMKHGASVTGNLATPTRNFQWSHSTNPKWTELLQSESLKELTSQLSESKKEADQVRGARLPVVWSLPPSAERSTRMFIRGNWMERGQEIGPAIPAAFGPNPEDVQTRLDMARWLVSDDNPLAARVWANRVWSELFGNGLVETLEDFGASGTTPTHPELLDHLSWRLREENQWRLKPFLRELVLSSTYRQTHQVDRERLERDATNQLYSRGPRTRLSAEMIRDQALAVSGLLQDQIGGPSVMPPQPDGVWQTVYSGAKWKTASGPDRYRRALYTYWRRTSPYPSFLMFDSPTRDVCSARRIATNTPLQALVTLNDPVYVECAQALAERATQSVSDATVSDSIAWIYQAVTQRPPTEADLGELESLYADLFAERQTSKAEAKAGSETETETVDIHTLSVVANTILNLDRALTK